MFCPTQTALFRASAANVLSLSSTMTQARQWKLHLLYRKLWEATKDNPQEDINVESFLKQDNYWNIGSFENLAKEMQLVLKADYSFPIILDEEYKLVDGAHRLVHAYLNGITHIKGVIIRNDQWPEPDYDELKEIKKKEV